MRTLENGRIASLVQPLNVEQAMQVGAGHHRAGRYREAEVIYRRVLTLRPDWPPAHANLGSVLAANGKTNEAIRCYRQAQFLDRDCFEASYNLAKTFHEMGRWEEAVAAYRDAIRIRPDLAELHNNLGIALCSQSCYRDGIMAFRKALNLREGQPQTYNNLGNALCASGLYDESIGAYHRALALRPNYPAAHLNLGLVLLTQGNFVRGWPEYEWRWRLNDPRPRLHLATPWWDGDSLDGRTILLHNEQGYGDTIQFVRYLPEVAKRGGKTILICPPAVIPLFQGLKGVAQIIAPGRKPPIHDVHCPLLSLPGVVGTTERNIPAQVPYITAEAKAVDEWKARIPKDKRIKVGLAWAGQPTHANDRNRSLRLQQLAPVAEVANVWFCSLQKGLGAKQAKAAERPMEMVDWTEELKHFGDTAALIAALDLVITVDTAVAHLAGAIAKPVWVLLPFVPDWRWMLGRSDSPWYPGMRLFRQPRFGDWATPIRHVAEALRTI